jgi:hypothetical protein
MSDKIHPDLGDAQPGPDVKDEPDPVPGVISTEQWQGIGNEFTGVLFRKVRTNNGERLQLFVPRRGHSVTLDPMQLEIVAAQDPAFFSHLHAKELGAVSQDAPDA